jgi:hypothetical protein
VFSQKTLYRIDFSRLFDRLSPLCNQHPKRKRSLALAGVMLLGAMRAGFDVSRIREVKSPPRSLFRQ